MQIIPINEEIRKQVDNFIISNWGSSIMVTRGRIHDVTKLPGYAALDDGVLRGLITYYLCCHECEIVSLDSLLENTGIGTRLINCVVQMAEESSCSRIWLVTTNDNTRAIRFYQKRGFNMDALYVDAVQQARKLKPEIPLYGNDDIPILHEIEFEKRLVWRE